MFRRPAQGPLDTVVGSETQMDGHVSGSGSLRVDGRLQGEVDIQGDCIIGPDGVVIADIRARDVVIAGEVRGDVHAAGRLELLPSSRLFGDIHAQRLAITDGAVFRGNCQPYSENADTGEDPFVALDLPEKPARPAAETAAVEVGRALEVQSVRVSVGGATAVAASRAPATAHPLA